MKRSALVALLLVVSVVCVVAGLFNPSWSLGLLTVWIGSFVTIGVAMANVHRRTQNPRLIVGPPPTTYEIKAGFFRKVRGRLVASAPLSNRVAMHGLTQRKNFRSVTPVHRQIVKFGDHAGLYEAPR